MNIEVSARITRLPPYLFGRINALKAAKRRAGCDVIDLGMGNPIDPSPDFVVDKLAIAARDPHNHRYSASAGLYNLRRELARKYERRYGVQLDPDKEVVVTIGSKEGFSHLMLAMLGAGDTVVVGDPAYPIHVYAVALAGGNVISVPLGNDAAFLTRVEDVLKNLYPRPKLLVLNYPHNPSAITVEPLFYRQTVELARQYNVLVINDFAYGETCFDGYQAPSFLAVPGGKEVGVELSTMSKPYNMAGWRVGFCCGNAEMVQALATIKGYYDYGHFAPIQIASILALRNGDEFVAAQAQVYQRRRDVLVAGLRKIGWQADSPRASMFVWARVAKQHLAGQGTIDFSLRLLEEAEVAVAPGRGFGANGEGFVRIALVENELRIKQALRQMDACLNGRKHQRPRSRRAAAPPAATESTGEERATAQDQAGLVGG